MGNYPKIRVDMPSNRESIHCHKNYSEILFLSTSLGVLYLLSK